MSLETALAQFSSLPLLKASRALFKDTLGIPLSPLADAAIEPKRFFRDAFNEKRHSGIDRLFLVGRVDDRAFQIAHELLPPEVLDLDATVKETDKDYQGMFLVAVEMNAADFTRSDLAARTREINRIFTNPVIVIFKHQLQKEPILSIGVASRRPHKRDKGKDVLGKVSMIREIRPQSPHRGHIEILKDFSLAELEKNSGKGKRGHKIDSFKSFHAALEAVFNTDLLNERFYKDLANWYFWALPQVEFPNDLEKDDEKRRATGLIRLLTRLIFCWFLKEKDGLIPDKLFNSDDLKKLLKGFDPESETSSTYYQAILQNLFFATLNQRMGKDGKGNPYRVFAKDEGFQKNRTTYDVNNLYRYEKLFAVPENEALALFADIPFLNGGLFECLDRTEDGTDKKRYLDGFSRRKEKRPRVPDRLFFDSGETADLSGVYDDKKRKAEKVTGLITILNRYKFTIVENTPIDQEIALDPELLGKVFENLLASYNEETKTTARKQTGSFYTPRPIVDYMVDECLKAHFTRCLVEKAGMTEPDARAGLDILFAYTEKAHPFSVAEVAVLIAAIDALKILDPACGSGAFPMGVLHKLVYILGKLDPDNDRWKQTQLAKLDSAPMREELERAFEENNDDYGRKLYLIENCLYGVDIQPIAIQITKLRFFISLVCDQKTNRSKKDNHGIRPLPNLETKFVAANTLIGLPEMDQMELVDPRVYKIEAEIETLCHKHFSIQRRDQKLAVQGKVKALRKEMADLLAHSLMSRKKSEHIAEWDPFDPQSSADFFDPHWMFGRSLAEGFDIVIGNPPYISYYSRQAHAIQESVLNEYRLTYEFLTGTKKKSINTVMLFLERGLVLLKEKGVYSYIIDIGFFEKVYAEIRRYIARYRIDEIVTDLSAFENVASGQLVIRGGKIVSNGGLCVIKRDFDATERTLAPSDFCSDTISLLTDRSNYSLDLEEVIQLGQICEVSCGLEYGALRDLFLSPTKKNLKFHKVLNGGASIPERYVLIWNEVRDGYVLFDKEYESRLVKDGRNVSASGKTVYLISGDEEKYQTEKLLIRQSAMAIVAAYDDGKHYALRSLFICTRKTTNYDLFYIIAILNSKFITYYALNNGIIRYSKGKQPQIRVTGLNSIPIKVANKAEQLPLIKLARNINSQKQAHPAAETSVLEREIDQQVYALYGLTSEEIAIVEGTAP